MAFRNQQVQNIEDNIGSKATIGPCGFIYIYPKSHFNFAEISLLGDRCEASAVLSLPLLHGVTVEDGFLNNVKAVHKKVDLTTISVRLTTYHSHAFVFHNGEEFTPIFQGPGLRQICETARDIFGYSKFTPVAGLACVNAADVCPPIFNENDTVMAVAVTEGFKERLFFGKLVYVKSQLHSVLINKTEVYKVPLYDEDLFAKQNSIPRFYSPELSEYMYYNLYTGMAQALRIKNVTGLIEAIQNQFTQDKYKIAKLSHLKEFTAATVNSQDSTLMVIDAVASELALSYGMSFLEAPQDKSKLQDYLNWDIFSSCETDEERVKALERWNAHQAIHVHAQLFSTNSVFYINRIAKQVQSASSKVEPNVYNSYYLQHGLANLADETLFEGGDPAFGGIPTSALNGNYYTVSHLAYAASFSANALAKMCYYLQFCQHQRSTLNPAYSVQQYVGSAANSDICEQCRGECPCVCINTLFYRLKDRFPPVIPGSKRDPYVVTGVTNVFNELDFLGNFASFKDKDDEQGQADEVPKYTYWQLNQTVVERLETLGILEHSPQDDTSPLNGTMTMAKFMDTFKEIDNIVDTEVVKFINTMTKNNVNFRESVKGIHHIVQYICNPYWQAPCSVFKNLFYRTLLTVFQDIALPISIIYESENPSHGSLPSEWLKMHYQTLWTNFKSFFIDKGVITGSEFKIMHGEQFSDFFDLDAACNNMFVPVKVQVRLAKAQVIVPKNIKIKNRILFSGTNMSDQYQNAFLKSSGKKENYILNGPYVKFLNEFHRTLFPNLKISSLYMWSNFCKRKQIPAMPDVPKEELSNFFSYISNNSRLFDEVNLLDVIPDSFVTYAKQRLNNAILRACGQTQFYAGTLHSILPKVQYVSAAEYPHVLNKTKISSVGEYEAATAQAKAMVINSSIRESASNVARLRPIITLPIVVNKYTGITGNAQIFQSANLGYFMGRGVDKNLLMDSYVAKRQPNAYMRRRHVFITPLVGTLIKHSFQHQTTSFEIEAIKKSIQVILEEKQDERVFNSVTCELVKSLGFACKDLNMDDLEFFLGQYSMFANNILENIEYLSNVDGPWTEEWAKEVLEASTVTSENVEFVPFDYTPALLGEPQIVAQGGNGANVSGRKRKLHSMLNNIDL
ncbi:single-stranded DNA binding protein [Bovine gammaherpesvirus 6]|uniref:Single-stranded DNA binding protein n=1 Tax=Bovine gammaherpesvirus 6 TaxID=1504288 RepID=A0A060CXG4_9GAMA|nr:single-stranded DNA binding protein [Bovine gammaherpesvirus 6]AIB03163.1 single-stranded DNA binding protein [Bovine gammaherpesvirus 6]